MYRIKTFKIKKKHEGFEHVKDYQSYFYLSSFGDHFMFWEYLQVGRLVLWGYNVLKAFILA